MQVSSTILTAILFIPFIIIHLQQADTKGGLTKMCPAFLGTKLPCFTMYSHLPSGMFATYYITMTAFAIIRLRFQLAKLAEYSAMSY